MTNQSAAVNVVRATESQCNAIALRYSSVPRFVPAAKETWAAIVAQNPDACINYELVEIVKKFMLNWSQHPEHPLTNELSQVFLKTEISLQEACPDVDLEKVFVEFAKAQNVDLSEKAYSKEARRSSRYEAQGEPRQVSNVLAQYLNSISAE